MFRPALPSPSLAELDGAESLTHDEEFLCIDVCCGFECGFRGEDPGFCSIFFYGFFFLFDFFYPAVYLPRSEFSDPIDTNEK